MPTRTMYEPDTPSWVDLASPDLPASPVGRFAVLSDPKGAVFAVIARAGG